VSTFFRNSNSFRWLARHPINFHKSNFLMSISYKFFFWIGLARNLGLSLTPLKIFVTECLKFVENG